MNSKKILITGAGGAAAIAFFKAIQPLKAEVCMADMSPCSAGLYLVNSSHRCLLKAANQPDYVPHLLALCAAHEIEVLVPTVDAELVVIAQHRQQFEELGVQVITSTADVLSTVLDKYSLMQHLSGHFDMPWFTQFGPTTASQALSFPLIAKPKSASGSRGIRLIEQASDLDQLPTDGSYLLQEYLPGQEYSVDVYLDRDHHAVASVVRERMKTYGGVAVVSQTIDWPELSSLAAKMAEYLQLRYAVNIQYKIDAHGQPRLLEINPRFPGTASLTVSAGVNMPQMCLFEAMGYALKHYYPYDEIAMVRMWQEVFMPTSELQQQTVVTQG